MPLLEAKNEKVKKRKKQIYLFSLRTLLFKFSNLNTIIFWDRKKERNEKDRQTDRQTDRQGSEENTGKMHLFLLILFFLTWKYWEDLNALSVVSLSLVYNFYSYLCQVVAFVHANGCQGYFVYQGEMTNSENSSILYDKVIW